MHIFSCSQPETTILFADIAGKLPCHLKNESACSEQSLFLTFVAFPFFRLYGMEFGAGAFSGIYAFGNGISGIRHVRPSSQVAQKLNE
jgi:hypothetical protein